MVVNSKVINTSKRYSKVEFFEILKNYEILSEIVYSLIIIACT
jgi:hypothetical protein